MIDDNQLQRINNERRRRAKRTLNKDQADRAIAYHVACHGSPGPDVLFNYLTMNNFTPDGFVDWRKIT